MPRMTIEFPDQANEMLKELAKKGQTTKVDVIRRALALYNYVQREAKDKDRRLLITGDDDETIKEIVFDI